MPHHHFLASPRVPAGLFLAVFAGLAASLHAASGTFTIDATTSTATQSLGSGQTGTVTSTGTLSVSGSSVAVTITGSATLTNSGTITQIGTGRAIRDNTGGLTLAVVNNAGATIQTADADVIQMAKASSSITFSNYGTLASLNASKGGAQAIDWNAITTGSNTLTNYSTGLITAFEADAVRPGVNGFVYNDGTIKSTNATGSSSGSDGIDAQTNSGITIVNAFSAGSGTGTGLIEGARHGITGGAADASTAFTMSITNHLGGTIQGDNGSGLNIDGFNATEVVTLLNHGTITGNGHDIGDGAAHDGDGVDVDGIVDLTNSGTIRSLNSFGVGGAIESSEGVTVGGGTIVNSGLIEGSVADGNTTAIGRGITIAGVDKDAAGNPIAVQAPYAATTITNSGTIKGDTDAAIIFTSALTSGFGHTITNQAGGTIVTGGATTAAIVTGADAVTINNAGTIDGSTSGKAITGGAGNLTVNVLGSAAVIKGDITGGAGVNKLSFDLGSPSATFRHAGAISAFDRIDVVSGRVTLADTIALSGGAHALLSVAAGAALSPGAGALTLTSGDLAVDGALSFSLTSAGSYGQIVFGAANAGTLTLGSGSLLDLDLGFAPTTGTQFTLVDLANSSASINGIFAGHTEGSIFAVGGTNFQISYHGGTGNDLTLTAVSAVPEPATWAALASLGALGLAGWRRRTRRAC
jgi:hypothetical protein